MREDYITTAILLFIAGFLYSPCWLFALIFFIGGVTETHKSEKLQKEQIKETKKLREELNSLEKRDIAQKQSQEIEILKKEIKKLKESKTKKK